MNWMRTALLLAAMTALFMGVGYMLGGSTGIVIAFIAAAVMNLVSFWNADRMVLSMHHARPADDGSAPELVALVG